MPPGKARRKSSRLSPDSAPPAERASRFARLSSWIDHHAAKLALALILVASIRIIATYDVFSHTNDEPAHIACGMEWLAGRLGSYRVEHPPLARVAGAIGPHLMGAPARPDPARDGMYQEGLATLYDGVNPEYRLFAARLGVLPFFWVAAFVVYLWAKRDFGGPAAILALFLFTFIPPILAHAGLVTTDMALTAWLGAAFLAGRYWLERPTFKSGAIFGACGALAILSKFSSLLFFPAASVVALIAYAAAGQIPFDDFGRRLKERIPSLGVAVAVALFLIWAAYRFSIGKVDFTTAALPSPDFLMSVREVFRHNTTGHPSYLFGKISQSGFPGYYLVVLGVKTPIALLVLTIAGVVFLKSEWRSTPALLLPAAYSAAILAAASFSHINIGVRHVLPIYTGASILAAIAILRLAATADVRKWLGPALVVLLGWYTLSSVLSHPDYIPYFNEFAGSHPENILVDSDLDWGQDVKRLFARLDQGHARLLTVSSMYFLHPGPGMPYLREGRPQTPLMGWNAVGLTYWKLFRLGQFNDPHAPCWPDKIPPQEIVGKSIYLWYFPPNSGLPLE